MSERRLASIDNSAERHLQYFMSPFALTTLAFQSHTLSQAITHRHNGDLCILLRDSDLDLAELKYNF